jgi:Kef-type K+ transport system membrane component KefB/mannitol/fructose-specific phosphotransferase system IIA component (Ntr-type)
MELSLLNLLAVLVVAWLAGLIASRLGYPAVLGELLAGIALGPPLLGLLQGGEALAVIAEVGILLMMLYIGMEIDPSELGRASKGGLLAALGGFITPFVLCYLLVVGLGFPPLAGVFVGLAAGVTSLATKSRILVDLHLLDTRIAHVMMAGALVADTLSLVLFAVVLGVAESGTFAAGDLAGVLVAALGYFAVATAVGLKVLPALGRVLERVPSRTAKFTAILLVMLAYAEGAHLVGMHGILGAFLAGLFLRESVLGRSLSQEIMHVVRDVSIGFLAPVFFVTAGFAVSLDVFRTDLALLLGLVALASVGKVVGTALFYLPTGYGWREGTTIGLGMNGRGAVEIIVAQIALSMGLITQDIFSVLVFMAIATTALVPVTLKWGVSWLRNRGELERSREERSGTVIVGGGPTARALAKALHRHGADVRIVDSSAAHVAAAQREGLAAVQGSALDERVLSQAEAAHAQHFVTLTANPEVNVLAAQLARTSFAVPELFLLDRSPARTADAELAEHLGASVLFGGPVRLDAWDLHVENGEADIRRHTINKTTPLAELAAAQEGDWLPLVVVRDEVAVPVRNGDVFEHGDVVFALLHAVSRDDFHQLMADAPVLDLDGPLSIADFAKVVSEELAPRIGTRPERLMERLISRETTNSTVILPGLAIPHVRMSGRGTFETAIVRCREGIYFPNHEEPVRAAFVIVAAPDVRSRHLRTLSAIAQVVQSPDFERQWLEAPDAEALRQFILGAPRRRVLDAPSGLEPSRN